MSNPPLKLLNELRRRIRDKHYSLSTERACVYWARWFIRFHGLRHPRDMGAEEIRLFLSHLVNKRNVTGATYTQALCAPLFLYKDLLGVELEWIEGISRPKRPPNRPTVLTQQEVNLVLGQMKGIHQLVARLLYGTGMRLSECAQLGLYEPGSH